MALLPECVVSYISPLHTRTRTESLFFYLLVSSVCRRPPTPLHPEYAMKAAGSLVPTHFHNAVYTGREGEGRGQRGESLLSPVFFFLSQRKMLSLPGRRTAGEEKMASLLVGAGACRLFSSHFLSLCYFLSCVLTNLKQKNTQVHVLLNANSVVSRLFFSFSIVNAGLSLFSYILLLPFKARNRDVDNSIRHTKLTLILMSLLAC